MKNTLIRIIRLFIGLFISAIGIVFMINANLGLSPWDVLHEGISNNIGVTIGKATISVGVVTVAIDVLLGENIGWGTFFNMMFVGTFMDILINNNLVPESTSIIMGLIMLIIGMIIMSIGVVLYMGAGFGSGPRDGLMVALQKRINKPVKQIRLFTEAIALTMGFALGGTVGIGTVITAIGLGHVMQIVFGILKFDTTKVNHRFIVDDIKSIKDMLRNKKDLSVNEELAEVTDEL